MSGHIIGRNESATQAHPFEREASASLALEPLADATHAADVLLGRISAVPFHQLPVPLQALARDRAAVALNLGDVALLERAIEQTAVRLRLALPEIAFDMVVARALATTAIGTWVSFMSGARRRS